VSSAWIIERKTPSGKARQIVRYKLGGREAKTLHGGSFKSKRDAVRRRAWIEGELAAMRVPDLRLFAASGSDALRTSIAKACKALGIPLFSPHDLRHRRISLLHLRGVPWARIGEQVGQRNLAVTANTYTHVMLDEGEVDYPEILAA
jgi:integrase